MRALLNLALTIVFILLAGAPALADKRIALVIGNSAYRNAAKLITPANDAAAVAHMLKSAGFDSAEVRQDQTLAEMSGLLREFRVKSRDADVAVIYFAGYAAQLDGTNFLIPVDATRAREKLVLNESLLIDDVMFAVHRASKLGLVLLDACGEYPFVKSTKALSQPPGLANVESPPNVLVAFSAKAESIGSDCVGQNSPFSRALLDHLTNPELDIRIAFGRIRDDVMRATANAQEPSLIGSLAGEFYLIGPR